MSLRSTQSISSSNLGLSSGDDLPSSSGRDRRSPDVRVVTPLSSTMILADTAHVVGDVRVDNGQGELAPALAEGDSVRKLHLTESTASNESALTATTATTSRSVSNPSSSTSNSKFRARPAPPTTTMEGLGPRLTKSAALRQGLKWEDPRDIRRMTGEGEVPVAFDDVPGHKRNLALVSREEQSQWCLGTACLRSSSLCQSTALTAWSSFGLCLWSASLPCCVGRCLAECNNPRLAYCGLHNADGIPCRTLPPSPSLLSLPGKTVRHFFDWVKSLRRMSRQKALSFG